MEENADSLFTFILFIIIIVITPLVMLYRRGYFFNIRNRIKSINYNYNSPKLPSEWTTTSLYKLSWLDKLQIDSIRVIADYYNGHKVRFHIKGGKFIEYPFENSNYLQDNTLLGKDKILIREMEKKNNCRKSEVITI